MAGRMLRQFVKSFSPSNIRDAFKGTSQRELQERYDTHKLYLYLALGREQTRLGGGGGGGAGGAATRHVKLPDGFAKRVAGEAAEMAFDAQRAAVQREMRRQVAGIGAALHGALVAAGDAAPAASALVRAAADAAETSTTTTITTAAHGGGGGGGLGRAAGASTATPGATTTTASSSSASTTVASPRHHEQPTLLSQAEVSALLRSRLGYSLAVAPSRIEHADAGLGLFVDDAGGAVPAGAVVALFPGLCYSPGQHMRLPGYPKVDSGNPYLVARYDRTVVDSLPWGRGWLAPPLPDADDAGDGGAAATPSALGAAGRAAAAAARARAARRPNFLQRVVSRADGPPRRPIPATEWVAATSAEAAALELLEGRHPLALAQYANHPAPGAAPNTMVAPFTFQLLRRQRAPRQGKGVGAGGGESGGDGNEEDSDDADADEDPAWLRAYVPNVAYAFEELAPADLLDQRVHAAALIALRPLPPGAEVVFNYRLSPGLLGRPLWYTPVDEGEEDRRWAAR